jgi:hypothetical protein
MGKLFCDLVRLVRSWWAVDRIRISPEEGRLWRLRPPCILLVDGRPAEVIARTLSGDEVGLVVSYDCRTAQGDGRLTVRGVAGSTPKVVWMADGVERPLVAHEIEVFATTRAGGETLARDGAARYSD